MRIGRKVSLVALCVQLCVGCSRQSTPNVEHTPAEWVGYLLYEENLIADPEVAARVRASIIAVDRDGFPADSVLPQLHTWLERWARDNPDRVQRAHLMLRVPHEDQRHSK